MAVECPHCHTRVAPAQDGTCPACRADTRDARGTDPTVTSITIEEGQELPPLCARCACKTDTAFAVRRTTKPERESVWIRIVLPLWMRAFFKKDPRRTVTVRVPLCDACYKRGPLVPEHVDYEYLRMRFLVHTEFKRIARGHA